MTNVLIIETFDLTIYRKIFKILNYRIDRYYLSIDGSWTVQFTQKHSVGNIAVCIGSTRNENAFLTLYCIIIIVKNHLFACDFDGSCLVSSKPLQ